MLFVKRFEVCVQADAVFSTFTLQKYIFYLKKIYTCVQYLFRYSVCRGNNFKEAGRNLEVTISEGKPSVV
jgi:hypothetical protein